MKNKEIKRLLQIMLDNYQLLECGLCHLCLLLYMTDIIKHREYKILYSYIQDNKPKHITEKILIKNKGWWWKQGSITPRVKWIHKHIKLNS